LVALALTLRFFVSGWIVRCSVAGMNVCFIPADLVHITAAQADERAGERVAVCEIVAAVRLDDRGTADG
jgi:hypothetical protein